jgi:hypothetical protein
VVLQDRAITSDDLISKRVARPRLFNRTHSLKAALDSPDPWITSTNKLLDDDAATLIHHLHHKVL